jgi:hypothetical protein
MLKGKERKIVLDCLYQEIYKNEMRKSGFAARSAMIAKVESQLKYENIPHSQRIDIYYNFISKKIIKYIEKDLLKSNTMYWVNGSSDKRDMRIEEYARYAFARMPKNQKIAICLKLGYKYLSNEITNDGN